MNARGCGIAGVQDIVVIGSQSILGMYPNAPEELLVSEVDDTTAILSREWELRLAVIDSGNTSAARGWFLEATTCRSQSISRAARKTWTSPELSPVMG